MTGSSTALPVRRFASRAAWEKWLAANHERSPGVWLELPKKGSQRASVTRTDALEVAYASPRAMVVPPDLEARLAKSWRARRGFEKLAVRSIRSFDVRSYVPALLLVLLAATARAQEPRFLNPSGLPPAKGYSHVVDVPAGHRLVFLSGQVPLDSAGTLRRSSDFRSQARQVFENLRAGLAAADADFGDVVKLNFYLLDVRHLPVLREVRDQYVNPAAPPASTLVEVRRLFREGVLLEVEAIAAVRDR